jgi:hypothetical protein
MGANVRFMTSEELEAALDTISQSPGDSGRLEMIVCRPDIDQRKVLVEGELDLQVGLVGDSWRSRGISGTTITSLHNFAQLTLMNSRVIALVAGTRDRWPLAGDQLFVDLDLSTANLPPGTRLKIGTASIEITSKAHTGCSKFADRFGQDALLFVNAPNHKDLHLRGVNARVMEPGVIKTGDTIKIIRKPV